MHFNLLHSNIVSFLPTHGFKITSSPTIGDKVLVRDTAVLRKVGSIKPGYCKVILFLVVCVAETINRKITATIQYQHVEYSWINSSIWVCVAYKYSRYLETMLIDLTGTCSNTSFE